MKRLVGAIILALLLYLAQGQRAPALAVATCGWTQNTSSYAMAANCTLDASATDYYDYSSGADDATNGYGVTVGSWTLTLNSGTDASNKTTLGVGSFTLTGSGSISVGGSNVLISPGPKCYVLDSDGDLYSPTPGTCSLTGGAGYIRKNKLTATTVDCGDGSANAKPGQTTYFTGTFTNGVNPALTHDWNCSGVETQGLTSIYSCNACTNGSGYASFQATTTAGNQDAANTGWLSSAPACGAAAATQYTVTNTTCRDPLVTDCSTSVTTASVSQTCL